MDDKLHNLETNKIEKSLSDDYLKSSDRKCERKDYDNFSNEQHNKKQDFSMVQFVTLNCIKIENTDEEETDESLVSQNVHSAYEIEGKFDKSDSCEGNSFKNFDMKTLEYGGIRNTNVEKIYDFDKVDKLTDNVFNTKHNEG